MQGCRCQRLSGHGWRAQAGEQAALGAGALCFVDFVKTFFALNDFWVTVNISLCKKKSNHQIKHKPKKQASLVVPIPVLLKS